MTCIFWTAPESWREDDLKVEVQAHTPASSLRQGWTEIVLKYGNILGTRALSPFFFFFNQTGRGEAWLRYHTFYMRNGPTQTIQKQVRDVPFNQCLQRRGWRPLPICCWVDIGINERPFPFCPCVHRTPASTQPPLCYNRNQVQLNAILVKWTHFHYAIWEAYLQDPEKYRSDSPLCH